MKSKIAVIIGGASGMGLGIAKTLGEHGTIFIGDLGKERVQNAVEELRALGINAHGQTCDVTDMIYHHFTLSHRQQLKSGLSVAL